MGEAVGGPNWPICRGAGCQTPLDPTTAKSGTTNPWAIRAVVNSFLVPLGIDSTSVWACTVEPLNKKPVTDSYWGNVPINNDCWSSDEGGPHRHGKLPQRPRRRRAVSIFYLPTARCIFFPTRSTWPVIAAFRPLTAAKKPAFPSERLPRTIADELG